MITKDIILMIQKIITLEFGVNIETNNPPKQIIENNIKFYKKIIHNTLKIVLSQ